MVEFSTVYSRPADRSVGLGDSRIAQIHNDANFLQLSGGNPFAWGNALSGHRLQLVANLGVAGDRTDQMLARVAAMLATNAGTLYLLGGVNDISQGYPSASTSGATAFANLKLIADAALAAMFKHVIIVLDPGSTTLGPAAVGQLVELNNRLREYADNTRGIILFDLPSAIWLPLNGRTTIAYVANSMRDGTHFGDLAGYLGGKVFSTLLQSILPARPILVDSLIEAPGTAGDTNITCNLSPNPLFGALTGGVAGTGVTGNVPNGWGIDRLAGTPTVVVTSGTPADGSPGNETILAVTFGAVNDEVRMYHTINTANWSIGDILQGGAEIVVDSNSVNLAGVYADLTVVTDAGASSARDLAPYTGANPVGTTESYKATLVTEKLVPVGTTKTSLTFSVRAIAGGAGSVTFRLRRASVRKRFGV